MSGFTVKRLNQYYGDHKVLSDVTFTAEPGEMIAVLGPNGSGKSTLVKTLCRILGYREGSVQWDGLEVDTVDAREFAKNVAYIPQDDSAIGYNRVFDSVLIGRRPHTDFNYGPRDLEKAADAVHLMGLDNISDKTLNTISGGQRQKVHIARAIAQDPRMFVLDEPTSALDPKNQNVTMRIMNAIRTRTGAGIIIALHDLNLALRYCEKTLLVKDGTVFAFGKTTEILTEETIFRVYGIHCRIHEDDTGTYIHILEGFEDDLKWSN